MSTVSAQKDDNAYPTWIGISCVDGVTPVKIKFNPSNGGMKVDSTTVISVTPSSIVNSDANGYPITKGVSTSNEDVVLPFYVNPSTGAVLVDSN